MADVVVIEVPATPVVIEIPNGVPVCIEVGFQGPPGPQGPVGPVDTNSQFWPRTLTASVTIPDDHTYPTRDLVIADGVELNIGDGSEVLNL